MLPFFVNFNIVYKTVSKWWSFLYLNLQTVTKAENVIETNQNSLIKLIYTIKIKFVYEPIQKFQNGRGLK